MFGARDRVDEAYDLARSVRDERFLYIRHYHPHVSWNQPEFFSDQAPIRQAITRLAESGGIECGADDVRRSFEARPKNCSTQ